jgi:hypothetical protein
LSSTFFSRAATFNHGYIGELIWKGAETVLIAPHPGKIQAMRHDEQVELSRLIDIVNERFGTEFKPADELFFNQLREEAASDDRKGDWRKPDNSLVVFRSCRQRYMQWLWRLYVSSPRAGCGKSARPVR